MDTPFNMGDPVQLASDPHRVGKVIGVIEAKPVELYGEARSQGQTKQGPVDHIQTQSVRLVVVRCDTGNFPDRQGSAPVVASLQGIVEKVELIPLQPVKTYVAVGAA